MTKRTDIHRPSEIIPADYEFVAAFSLSTTEDGWPIPAFNFEFIVANRDKFHGAHHAPNQCDVCGSHFIYGEVWEHTPTSEWITLGHICAHKYQLFADLSEFKSQRAKHVAKAIREAQRAASRESMEKQIAETPGLAEALEVDHYITTDIKAKFERYGSISQDQVVLLFKLQRQIAEQAAQKADAAANLVDVPLTDERITVEGEVLATRWDDNEYGGALKMLVKVTTDGDSFYKLWGTMPSALLDLNTTKGNRIRFVAKVKRSDDDSTFGFISRPTKPELLDGCPDCGHSTLKNTNWRCDTCAGKTVDHGEDHQHSA